jgi:hypothetical protein
LPELALFVKIAGKWRHEGIVSDPDAVASFIRNVEADIEATRDAEVKTETYRIFTLD